VIATKNSNKVNAFDSASMEKCSEATVMDLAQKPREQLGRTVFIHP
jgi:hypothetical protein